MFLHLFQKLEAWLRRRKSCCARRRWLSLGRSWCRIVLRRPKRGQGLRAQDAPGNSRNDILSILAASILVISCSRFASWSRGIFGQGEGLEGDPATDGERWEESEGQASEKRKTLCEDRHLLRCFTLSRLSALRALAKQINQVLNLLYFALPYFLWALFISVLYSGKRWTVSRSAGSYQHVGGPGHQWESPFALTLIQDQTTEDSYGIIGNHRLPKQIC